MNPDPFTLRELLLMAEGKWSGAVSEVRAAIALSFGRSKVRNPFAASKPKKLTPEQLKRNTEEAFREMEIFFRQQARQGK